MEHDTVTLRLFIIAMMLVGFLATAAVGASAAIAYENHLRTDRNNQRTVSCRTADRATRHAAEIYRELYAATGCSLVLPK